MGYFRRLWGGVWQFLISLDQLGNVALGLGSRLVGVENEYGHADETISSVLGRRAARGKLRLVERPLVWALDKLDENHVAEAIEWGVVGRQRMLSAPRDD